MSFHYPIGGGSGGGGVTSLNTLTGALNLVEGAGIDITTAGSDITIAAIGANVPSGTSLAVKVATTAALPGTPTYNNGTAGVGATLTRSSNGTTGTIDGVTAANLMVGDYILVKNQAAQLQNGVYSVTQQGSASLPYILTRVTEADTTAELDDLVVTAASGTTNKGVPYGQQTNNPVIGTNNIIFTATGIYMRQQTSGTQAVNQIPVYTGTALTQTKGTANFKYNPTNDLFTIRGIDYTFPANNGDASQVLTTDGSGTLSWTTPSGGSPAGSNNQIQINQSGSFFADSTFQKSASGFNVGLDHTTQSAVTFTGSGLDDLTLSGTFSGTYPTTYTVTIDGINKDFVNFPTSSISGSGFQIGETVTSTSSGSATIDAVNQNSTGSYENLVLSGITGTFLQFDTITGSTSGTTATLDADLSQQDTYTWTDGTTTVSNVICKTPGSTLISNNVLLNFDTGTSHTLSDSWTWTYSNVNQNVLDFSNNDYNFKSTFGTDTFGYQISDNLLGAGISGSVNTWTTTGGDLGISGFFTGDDGFGDNTFIIWSDGANSQYTLGKDSATMRINYLGNKSTLNLYPVEFDLVGSTSSSSYGLTLKSNVLSLGNLGGGNNTKITIDDANYLFGYLSGIIRGDALHNNSNVAQGDATQQDVRSGTYTPTLTNVTNITTSTAYKFQWMRVGNVVTVSGCVNIQNTATGASELGISLPIASDIGATTDCVGSAPGSTSGILDDVGWVIGDATNNRAAMQSTAIGTGAHDHWVSFTYEVK